MRIESTAQPQQFKPINPSGFHEGASTTAEKITALVVTLLATAASFFVLPAEAAVLLSGGLAILFSAMFCGSAENSENTWDLGGVFSRTVGSHPVRQPGLRNIPGTGHNTVIHRREDVHPNVVVRHHPNAQPVLVQHGPPQVRPNVHPQQPRQQQQHVGVGRGHNQQQPPVHPQLRPQQLRQPQQQNIGQPPNPQGARVDQRTQHNRVLVGPR